MTDSYQFLKALFAPKNANFEGGARAEKNMIFFVNIFQKMRKNAFFGSFFQNLPAAHSVWPLQGLLVLRESSENQFTRSKIGLAF